MPQVYEYGYFSKQKKNLPANLRTALNLTLTNMRQGIYNTAKQIQGNGKNLVKTKVSLNPGVAAATSIWENRIDGHWRVFYYTNPGGNLTLLCIGHLDENNRLMTP